MDRFLALTVFSKVVEKGSFVGAARALDLSPATVTEQVQALERHLKTRLLHRTTRRIALTGEGAAYVEHCNQILQKMEEADGMLAAQRISPKGTVRVQMPEMLAFRHVIPAMPRFLARYPEMSVELLLSAAAPDFVRQNLDLGLQITMDPMPGVVSRPIGLVRICTCASPAYLKRKGTPKTLEDLAHHELIGVRGAPGNLLSSLRFQVDGKLRTIESHARLIADSGEAQRTAALAHGGIFQGAHYAVADLLESGKIVQVLKAFEWSGPPLSAVHPPNRFLSPKVQVFLDYVRGLLKDKVSPYRADWDNR